jgi:hypothetical protein
MNPASKHDRSIERKRWFGDAPSDELIDGKTIRFVRAGELRRLRGRIWYGQDPEVEGWLQ